MAGIAQAVAGNKVMDISRAVQRMVEVAAACGANTPDTVGRQMHEAPQVLNYGRRRRRRLCTRGGR